MNKKYLVRGALLFGTAGLIGYGLTSSEDGEAAPEDPTNWEAQYTTSLNETLIQKHEKQKQKLMKTFQEGHYTFEEPMTVQNPYDLSPLSALVLFETEQPAEVTVAVQGKTEDATVEHTYAGFSTEHQIPVLGLYPDMENTVILTAVTETGETMETSLTMATEPVPEDMLAFTVDTAQPEKMEPGMTFVSPSAGYPAAVDHNGDVRWYSAMKSYNQFKRLENGNLLLAFQAEADGAYNQLTEMDMLGHVKQAVQVNLDNHITSQPFHHDSIILENGNYLSLIHDGSENYSEDEIAELDRETGEVVRRLNLKSVFPQEMYEEYDNAFSEVGDWAHINAVWKLQDEEAVLLSSRHQDAIIKMSYPEAEFEWILSPSELWPEELEEYVLEPVDETMQSIGGPHAVMELPDQDEDDSTLDILLFDNNIPITRGHGEESEAYSRAVQYRIDQENGTVDEIWSYGEERGEDFYSAIVGDADYLPTTGNVLTTSGHTLNKDENKRYSVMVETTKTDNPEVVFELRYGGFGRNEYIQIYRAERMPLYPDA